MSNVLTAEEKKKIDSRLKARYLFVSALALTLAALVACLALVPALISVQIARGGLDAPSIEEVNGARDDNAQARRAQALVSGLLPLIQSTTTPSEKLAEALALLPAGISVTTATFQSSSNEIVLSGTSARREAVNAYRDALSASGAFASVAVPVSALAGTQEGRFTITLTTHPL